MTETHLYVEKDTDLMRSTFVAVGLADLFYRLSGKGSGVDVRIRDMGSAYLVIGDLSPDKYRVEVARRGALPALLPALTKKHTATEQKQIDGGTDPAELRRRYVPEGFAGNEFDYEVERQKVDADRAARKEAPQEGAPTTRDPRFSLWAHLISHFNRGTIMRVGYPLMLHAWHSHSGDQATALFDLILNAYGGYPNDLYSAQISWQETIKPALNYSDFERFGWGGAAATVSALSLVSPSTAQGSSTLSSARLVNTTIPDTFWLEFYLAMAGYMIAGIPHRSGNDALLYYPLPKEIRFSRLKALMDNYRGTRLARDLYDYSNLMPRAKVDALSQITFYLEMVKHYRRNQPERRRVDAINGLVGYYYKNLTAHTPFDETTFGLPRWMPEQMDEDSLLQAEAILEAHHEVLRALRGEHAEELIILSAYRRFVTLGATDDWIEFCILYGMHRFRNMVDQPWLPWIHITILEETLMNQDRKDCRPILENAGFRNIAAAIRECTVNLRYWKDVKKTQKAFKVRHGLGDDLLRSAHDAERFIEALGGFVHDYMRESSNVQANTGETRAFITDDDLYEVISLIGDYGSRVVASLLVAAGYASDYERKETNNN
jgi:hypothetical protein